MDSLDDVLMTLPDSDAKFVEDEIAILRARFAAMTYSWEFQMSSDRQVGYLAGLMDLEDKDRYLLLSFIMGDNIETSKDIRITKGMMTILIDYYLNGNGNSLNEALRLRSLRDVRAARRAERIAAKAEKAARSAAKNTNAGVLPMLEAVSGEQRISYT